MENIYPAIAENVPHYYFPPVAAPGHPRPTLRWLLELEIDGTIRYSNIHPQGTLAEDSDPVIGANFFELPTTGRLSAFKRDFVGFVKSVKNRETFHLRAASGVDDEPIVIVLTRSFDTTDSGLSSAVVLMELKSV